MIRIIYIFFLFINCLAAAEDSSAKLKTLVLIIATDDKPAYKELQKIWEVYMNSDSEHFEVYFLRADPNLSSAYEIRKNEIIVKTEENYTPGIVNKTILGMQAMQDRLKEFDYVIRTNLSSFFPFENLLKYLTKLPRVNCYAGVAQYHTKKLGLPPEIPFVHYVSGAGIILSRDLVELFINNNHKFERYKRALPDDVFIGMFYNRNKIKISEAQRWDYPTYNLWLEHNHKIEEHAYHFRARNSYALRQVEDPYEDELLVLNALLKKYYPHLIADQSAQHPLP